MTRPGITDEDERMMINDSPVLTVLNDDYGRDWESRDHAARWSPHVGWHRPF